MKVMIKLMIESEKALTSRCGASSHLERRSVHSADINSKPLPFPSARVTPFLPSPHYDYCFRVYVTHNRLTLLAHLQYRVPGFLATSFQEKVANKFIQRQSNSRAKWIVKCDPRGEFNSQYQCKQVHYIDKTHIPGEFEYLFAPFSVFTVSEDAPPQWSTDVTTTPHIITIIAAADNSKCSEDLPLAPWY